MRPPGPLLGPVLEGKGRPRLELRPVSFSPPLLEASLWALKAVLDMAPMPRPPPEPGLRPAALVPPGRNPLGLNLPLLGAGEMPP